MWECVYIYAHKVYLKVKLFLFERENGSFKLFHFPLVLFAKSSAKRFIHLCWCSGGSGRSGGHREQGERGRRVSLLGPGARSLLAAPPSTFWENLVLHITNSPIQPFYACPRH